MKYLIVTFFTLFSFCTAQYCQGQQKQLIYPPQEERWNPDSLGNQRVVVYVKENRPEITVEINWRNRNVKSNQKVYVVDSSTNKLVTKVTQHLMSPEKGIITFKPSSGKGIYYIYYLPYRMGGRSRYYPDAIYKTIETGSSSKKKSSKIKISDDATVLRMEPMNDFNSNEPMEVIATEKEVESLKSNYKGKDYLVFPEAREYPIKMLTYLPQRWILQPVSKEVKGKAKRGEYFTFQLGIWPIVKDLEDINITFSDLSNGKGGILPSGAITCFNTEGIDYKGKPMTKIVNVKNGEVQPLWFGLHVPERLPAGIYSGTAILKPGNSEATEIDVRLEVSEEQALNGEIDKPWKQTRLHWINSTLAQENTVIAPYTPLRVSGNTISFLGRKLILGENGLPSQIESYFTEEMTSISNEAKNILSAPFEFNIVQQDGKRVRPTGSGVSYIQKEAGTVIWSSEGKADGLTMKVKGVLEFDGHVNYEVKLIANEDISFQDIAMIIPMNIGSSKYILGLGNKGGFRPKDVNWKWDVAHKNQDGAWLGDVNAGLQFTLKDENYQRPLNTNFYLQKPLVEPRSWANDGKGGIKMVENGNAVNVNNYSGARIMRKGDSLYYNFSLLITPFHALQTDAHWKNRYFHSYKPIDSVLESGSNVINIHHANRLNPYINYPFIATNEMGAYIDSAHSAGLKVKIYNTIREVSNHLYELYPLKSLGDEIITPKSGKQSYSGSGYSWLQEHIHEGYTAAWFVPFYKDAAILDNGMSRWNNYYVEGMNWLVDNIGIDGIYLDDVAFDRTTMKRIKRVMTKNGFPGLIDLHSANQYNERDGFNNSAFLYMEHFPYLNRLWFGEYFDYENSSPEFFLTEVSGIPFGLMGEMLQDGGNPWRGMLYGMTNRMPYQEKKPDNIWKVWDSFGMEGSRMIGYWVSNSPVKTNREDVLATVYQKDNKVLVSLASWAPADTEVLLNINWEMLGINPETAKITAPEVRDFQNAASFKLTDKIPVQKNKGWLLIIE